MAEQIVNTSPLIQLREKFEEWNQLVFTLLTCARSVRHLEELHAGLPPYIRLLRDDLILLKDAWRELNPDYAQWKSLEKPEPTKLAYVLGIAAQPLERDLLNLFEYSMHDYYRDYLKNFFAARGQFLELGLQFTHRTFYLIDNTYEHFPSLNRKFITTLTIPNNQETFSCFVGVYYTPKPQPVVIVEVIVDTRERSFTEAVVHSWITTLVDAKFATHKPLEHPNGKAAISFIWEFPAEGTGITELKTYRCLCDRGEPSGMQYTQEFLDKIQALLIAKGLPITQIIPDRKKDERPKEKLKSVRQRS